MKTVLAMCGGGIRGLFTVRVLQNIVKEFDVDLTTSADVLAGTSTGSDIISYVIAGMSLDAIFDQYRYKAPEFYKNIKNYGGSLPAYDVQDLVAAQNTLHGPTTTLAQIDSKYPKVIMTSFDVNAWAPILFNNLPGSTNASTLITDAVVGSSAMPGMFGSWKNLIDGAFVNHDPTLPAAALICKQYGVTMNKDVSVICIGTGLMPNWIGLATDSWGAGPWQSGPPPNNPISSTRLSPPPGSYPRSTTDNLPPLLIEGTLCPILNCILSGTSTNLYPDIAYGLFPDEWYTYVNATLPGNIPENAHQEAQLQALVDAADSVDLTAVGNVLNWWPVKSSKRGPKAARA